MKTNSIWLIAILATAGLIAVFAQGQSKPSRDPLSGLLFPPEAVIEHRAKLGLSETQVTSIKAEVEAALPTYRDLQRSAEAHAKALHTALQKTPLDEAAVRSQHGALLNAERAVKELEFKVMLKVRLILTEEQLAQARSLSGSSASQPKDAAQQRVAQKLDALKAIVEKLEHSGKPPREHEAKLKQLQQLVRENNAAEAEVLIDELLRQLSPTAAVTDETDLKAKADRISELGSKIPNRKLREQLQARMNEAKAAAQAGNLARANDILTAMEQELASMTEGDADWSAMIEMDAPLNTNFTRGQGFIIGGTDPDDAKPVIEKDGKPFITTDASQKTFPNQRTDVITFDANSKPLTDLARSAAQILGQKTTLKFHRPVEGFMEKVERGTPKVQFIVNQLFTADGNEVLANWVLPPGWTPGQRYVTLIGVPGMSHTNNSKMFATPSFLKAYLTALKAAQGAGIIMVQFNCGGRSAMGLHHGFEQALDAALKWGVTNLGARRDAIVLNGSSRGGYGALCWGGRLAALGYGVRGIFASVFGIASAETSHPFELVSSMATNYGIYGDDFNSWKHLLYETDGADIRLRYMGVPSIAETEKLGPIGAAELLGAASKQAPISIYLAYGSADPTSLMSSYHRTYNALKQHAGLQLHADFFMGCGHEAGNDERNEHAAQFVAALARGESPQLTPQRRYLQNGSIVTDRVPAHLRLPIRTAPGRTPICDITGPAGAEYAIRLLDADSQEIAQEQGQLSAAEFAMPKLAAPKAGTYKLEFRLNDQLIGSKTFVVEPQLPATYDEIKTQWLADRMPVIEEAMPAKVTIPSTGTALVADLLQALQAEDATAIRAAVEQGRVTLDDKAGDPEVPDQYDPVPPSAKVLTAEEARQAVKPSFAKLEQLRFWKIGVDPTTLSAPLRAPGAVVSGMTALHRAKLDDGRQALAFAKDAADFLIWAQEQAGAGCYPFPAAKNTSQERAMQVATRFLDRAEAAGKLGETVRNGWAFEDHGDGGMQFDNGECGVAMFELYEVTKAQRYLDSALKAADWAITRPLCTNWNYNSFSVNLLAKAHQVTQQPKYLAAALKKAKLGVIPGQLTDGPRAGRWMDPHNARPAYHYLMLGALAQLAAELPATHADRPTLMKSLTLGLKTRNAEIITQGIMTKDKAIEALLLIDRRFDHDPVFLAETQCTQALNLVCDYASEQARSGRLPLGPRGWCEMLARCASP